MMKKRKLNPNIAPIIVPKEEYDKISDPKRTKVMGAVAHKFVAGKK